MACLLFYRQNAILKKQKTRKHFKRFKHEDQKILIAVCISHPWIDRDLKQVWFPVVFHLHYTSVG
jgi:hypothetical protein